MSRNVLAVAVLLVLTACSLPEIPKISLVKSSEPVASSGGQNEDKPADKPAEPKK